MCKLRLNYNRITNKGIKMKLSPKEIMVLTLVAKGYVDKEIGTRLSISERTVQTHLTRIMLKLNARNRVNAAVLFFIKNPDLFKKYFI